MDLATLSRDPRIRRILTHPEDDAADWRSVLARFLSRDVQFTRHSAGEAAISALQRLMVFLGYSTASSGAFLIDGDFGRGTNRGLAQFIHDQQLAGAPSRDQLCYPCRWNSARRLIVSIPEVALDPPTLQAMLLAALVACEQGRVMSGDLQLALFHLDALHRGRFLTCREILERYGDSAIAAARRNGAIRPEWVLAIIRQESAGIIRPRFEQHYLSRLGREQPEIGLRELRMQSMSLGLGQIMGSNYRSVGAESADDLFCAPPARQVDFVARFLVPRRQQTRKANPDASDFHRVARFYNGPQYATHHYHEQLARWFREFRLLLS
ncbi:MAG: N-acetylmuramidase domain-containing protein [Sedimenticola sp.]|nr:N-acetylmuramidase domain-containing protein [Sedimenticola sp.]